MANVTRKRTGELLKVVVQKLKTSVDEGLRAKEILDFVGETVELSEYELGHFDSTPDSPRYEKIIRFATIDLVKAGWLRKSKGRWYLTEEGIAADKDYKGPEDFYGEAVRLYRKWKRARDVAGIESDIVDGGSEELAVSITFEEAEETAWSEIKSHLETINPFDFQDFVAHLLKGMNYHVSWVSPPGKDGGTDIIAYPDPLGTDVTRIKVQVKHRPSQKSPVGDLRAFMSILGQNDVGLFVSTGGFTKDALAEARNQEQRRITCINLENLFDLWVEYYDTLSQDARQMLPLKPIYFLAPEE